MGAKDVAQTDNRFGAFLQKDGGVLFRLWAPDAHEVKLSVNGTLHSSERMSAGWYECKIDDARAGTEYQWKIDGSLLVPDPASRFNPGGPHEPSVVVDPNSFQWSCEWFGKPWRDAVIYELHVGTFTPEGTYAAAEQKLDYLADLGITVIELMPLSTFTGSFGWGYDGVLPYAPYAGYGTPDQLKSFIQAAHLRSLMVILDVVYNHFGPDGSYLSNYARAFYTDKHKTPWGDAINFDADFSDIVREFFIGNALYWLDQYRFDGLRFDAVHAIKDDSALDVMDELAIRIRAAFPKHHKHLILENENNVSSRLPPVGRFDAQWNDDFHHALHVALTGETAGYYGDFRRRPVELVARSLTAGFVWEGGKRNAEGRREVLTSAQPQHLGAMVNYLSNHDQTGNRAFGERLHDLVPVDAKPLAFALSILTPSTPMIFAGEEFGSITPFLYFADYSGELGEAVTRGRLNEFGEFARRTDGKESELPPPCTPETFKAAKLDWDFADEPKGLAIRGLITRLLALRRKHFVPNADNLKLGEHDYLMTGERSFVLRWRYQNATIELACNLSDAAVPAPGSGQPWKRLVESSVIYSVGSIGPDWWSPWSAEWTIGSEH